MAQNDAISLAHLGSAERALGHKAEVGQRLAEVLRIAVAGRHWKSLLGTLPRLALLLADTGQVERTVELYSLVSREPFVANSQWFREGGNATKPKARKDSSHWSVILAVMFRCYTIATQG
jgi:hypothetical protein